MSKGKRIYHVRGAPFRMIFTDDLPKDYYGYIKWKAKDPKKGGTIRIRKGMPEYRTLDTVIHELLHAAFPDLEEDAIYETANAISFALMDLEMVTPRLEAPR